MAETIYISATEVRFAAGKFDSDYFYIRSGANAAVDFPMVHGKTADSKLSNNVGSASWKVPNWKFDSTNYSTSYTGYGTSNAFTAVATTVKIK